MVSQPKPLFNVDDLRRPVYSDLKGIVDIDLKLAPNIQSLHLREIRANSTEYERSWPWLLHFLSNIRTHNRLEVIELEVALFRKKDKSTNTCSWGDIDSILAGPGFPFLREVGVELASDGWEDVVRGLPLLRERGVLVNPHF